MGDMYRHPDLQLNGLSPCCQQVYRSIRCRRLLVGGRYRPYPPTTSTYVQPLFVMVKVHDKINEKKRYSWFRVCCKIRLFPFIGLIIRHYMHYAMERLTLNFTLFDCYSSSKIVLYIPFYYYGSQGSQLHFSRLTYLQIESLWGCWSAMQTYPHFCKSKRELN